MSEPPSIGGQPPPRVDGLELVKLAVEAWKKTVDVQQHFNDLELRVRNFAMTFAAAVLGLVATLAFKEGIDSLLPAALVAIGAVAWVAFYLMDRHWYHRFLDSAVEHGRGIEAWLRASTGTDIFSLASGIKKASAIPIAPKRRLHSRHRIDLFYGVFAVAFAVLIVAFYLHAPKAAATPERPEAIADGGVVATIATADSGVPRAVTADSGVLGVRAAADGGVLPSGAGVDGGVPARHDR
jgi:hypothetical protein